MNSYMPTNWTTFLEEIDEFLETYNLPRLNQEETDNLNRLTISSKIELIRNFPANKSTEPNSFIAKFY